MSEAAHSRPSGHAPAPLYDPTIPTPTHAERARTLLAQISTGTLAGPWLITRTFPLLPEYNRVDEFFCENNRDYKPLFGKQ